MQSRRSSRVPVGLAVSLLALLAIGLFAWLPHAAAQSPPSRAQKWRPANEAVQQQTRSGRTPMRPKPPKQGDVRHDTAFEGVPGSALQIRAVAYDGRTNGSLKVQVKNPTASPLSFSAKGLYFVPDGDPDTAPQRLGAVGPLKRVARGNAGEASEAGEAGTLDVPGGETVELALDVFCIDSHRPSPSPANRFRPGKTKLPDQLAAEIERRADHAVKAQAAAGARAPRPAAKHVIQNEVWQSRDRNWVELDGEGRQEVSKKR